MGVVSDAKDRGSLFHLYSTELEFLKLKIAVSIPAAFYVRLECNDRIAKGDNIVRSYSNGKR